MLDSLDRRLIIELQKDPRTTNTDLARILGTSESTVRRRVNRLISSGVIVLTAVPDPFKVGYGVIAFINLHIQLSKIESVAERLSKYPEVHYLCLCAGSTDIVIWVLVRSSQELSEFITKKLGKIPGILQSETMIHLSYPKRTLGWLYLEDVAPGE
jgi:Lrp/AsnC family transcriptional regulator for asnA, asnC and gidA